MSLRKRSISTAILVMCRRAALTLYVFASAGYAQPVLDEYQIKTSFLFNFIQFVDWPEDVLSPDEKFNLCVVGAERFGTALDAIAVERAKGRQIVLRRLDIAAQASRADCHMLFVASAADAAPVDVRPQRGLLTAGESTGFLKRGGIINLVEVQGRIRFEINQKAADEAGLTISSRLLRLAVR